jgi:hypothetical protein
MRSEDDVTVVGCDRCGPVPVLVRDVEVHEDGAGAIRFYAFSCPSCRDVATGGCPTLIGDLLRRGATRRALDCQPTCADAEVAALRAWLATEPDWASSL